MADETAKKVNVDKDAFIYRKNYNSNIELVKRILSLLKEISNISEKIAHEHYEYLKKELEKSIEEIKYNTLLDNSLYNIVVKLIETGKYDEAIELFITERNKMIEHELEMQKLKNEHELDMEKVKSSNFWQDIVKVLSGVVIGGGVVYLFSKRQWNKK
ncbi:hypothetical protein EPJ70_10880 [Brachyspira aalborgi]|uniref:Uncharacterized protein n=1 Tax=Brachyspira aalborgi TaxID=29522 RepID=A0A5C8F057_9SPIR|nr:hypothetical protein [Brachyspira aalborgi]TXJ43605.1 hypothetical protein EPJ70_10880 [Brachyspira aalborgi]